MHQLSVVYQVRRFLSNFCRGFRGYAYHTVTTRKMSNWGVVRRGRHTLASAVSRRIRPQLRVYLCYTSKHLTQASSYIYLLRRGSDRPWSASRTKRAYDPMHRSEVEVRALPSSGDFHVSNNKGIWYSVKVLDHFTACSLGAIRGVHEEGLKIPPAYLAAGKPIYAAEVYFGHISVFVDVFKIFWQLLSLFVGIFIIWLS